MKTQIVISTEPEHKSRIFSLKSINRNYTVFPVLIFLVLIVFKNPFIACTNVNSAFYNKVLNDFDTSSYFIALDIKSPYYKGRAIIENNNLYLFLNKTKRFDKERYKSFMKRILTHHRTLKIEDKDLMTWKFIKVYELESVIQIANRAVTTLWPIILTEGF